MMLMMIMKGISIQDIRGMVECMNWFCLSERTNEDINDPMIINLFHDYMCLPSYQPKKDNRSSRPSKNDSSADSDETTDERLKGIEPKMVELINNEVWVLSSTNFSRKHYVIISWKHYFETSSLIIETLRLMQTRNAVTIR